MLPLKLPAELRPEMVTAIIDSREQKPFGLHPLNTESGTLATGDYSVKGLERHIAVERKSLDDFVSCVGRERARFERELQRLLAFETRAVVIESTWLEMEAGGWRSKVSPKAVVGSAISWLSRGIPIIAAGDRMHADQFTSRLLFSAARRHWRELRTLAESVTQEM